MGLERLSRYAAQLFKPAASSMMTVPLPNIAKRPQVTISEHPRFGFNTPDSNDNVSRPVVLIHPYALKNPGIYAGTINDDGKIPERLKKTAKKVTFADAVLTQAELSLPTDKPPRPIPNLGNTCFVASVIQGWLRFQKPSLERKVLNPETSERDRILARTILNTVEQYENSQGNFNLTSFLKVVSQCSCFEYHSGTQQDAAELVTWLDGFMQPTTQVFVRRKETIDPAALKPREEILDMGDRVEVPYPGRISISPDRTTVSDGQYIITPGQNLLGALKKYFSPQDVREEKAALHRYVLNPEGIPEERRIPIIERQEILNTAPDELKVEIKRFVCDPSTRQTHRVGGALEIPENFTMPKDFFEDRKEATYELQSVISHFGDSPHSGHYTSSVKTKNGFFHTSDSLIKPINREEMLELASKGYLLVFRKRS